MKKHALAAICFFIVILNIAGSVCGQNQREADSLKLILEQNDKLSPSVRASIVNRIAISSASPDEIFFYAELLLKLASENKLDSYIINAYRYQGVAYRLKGDLKKSLESLFLSAQKAINHTDYYLQIQVYLEIANTYTANNSFKNALHYEKKAIELIRKHGNKNQLAINLLNTGFSYYTLKEMDSALLLYNEAEPLFEEVDMVIGKAYTLGNRALVYWKKGKYQLAEHDLLRAIDILTPLGDQYGMADYHNQLGNIYLEQKKLDKAIAHTQKAIAMAKALGLKEQIRDAMLLLSKLYRDRRDYQKALDYQTQYMAYKDSIENTENTEAMADMRTEFEVNLKKKEIDLLEKRQILQSTYIIIAIILLLLSIVVILYFHQRFRATKLISAHERKKHNEKIKDLLNAHETKALQAMVQGRDTERKRLAQELHNHFGSLLATIKVNLNGLDIEDASRLKTITALVDQACSDTRTMSHSLNMGISENFGLIPALKKLAIHLQQSGEIQVEFSATMCGNQMDSDYEIIMYRIVQELVSNVLKHAEATKLSILLTCFEEENLINILVQDNGKGFDKEKIKNESDGMGLSSLRQMVAMYQGDIKFDSNSTSGTTVNIDLPLIPDGNITFI